MYEQCPRLTFAKFQVRILVERLEMLTEIFLVFFSTSKGISGKYPYWIRTASSQNLSVCRSAIILPSMPYLLSRRQICNMKQKGQTNTGNDCQKVPIVIYIIPFYFVRTGCTKVPVDCILLEVSCVVVMQQNGHLDTQCLDSSYTCSFFKHAEGMCDQAHHA